MYGILCAVHSLFDNRLFDLFELAFSTSISIWGALTDIISRGGDIISMVVISCN